MTYKITDSCINCAMCVDVCPDSCISEGSEHYTINAANCSGCGKCADECPTGAIEKA